MKCRVLIALIGALLISFRPGIADNVSPYRFNLSFEEPLYAGMPVWAKIDFPASYTGTRPDVVYPRGFIWGCEPFHFSVKKDGVWLQPVKYTKKVPHLIGSCILRDDSLLSHGRIPLHITYDFSEPGTYLVNCSIPELRCCSPDAVQQSDWVKIEIKPFSDEQRDAWIKEKLQNVPVGDPAKMVGDFLPSIMAHPNDDVRKVLVDTLHHPNPTVRTYALNVLATYGSEVIVAEIPRVMKEKGPNTTLATDMVWHREALSSVKTELADTLLDYLEKGPDEHTASSIECLYILLYHGYYDWTDAPETPDKIKERVWKMMPVLENSKSDEVLNVLARFLGEDNNQRSRDVLWKLAEHQSVRETALVALCYKANEKDLPALGKLILTDDDAVDSVAYHLRDSYGAKADPYLVTALCNAPMQSVRMYSAASLVKNKHIEGFRFLKDAILGNTPDKEKAIETAYIYLTRGNKKTEQELVQLLDDKIKQITN